MLIVSKLESIEREIEIHSRNAIIHVLMSLEWNIHGLVYAYRFIICLSLVFGTEVSGEGRD